MVRLKSMLACVFAAALLLGGCAAVGLGDTTQAKLDNYKVIYTETLNELSARRMPCLSLGEESNACQIKAPLYRKIEPIRASAETCINDAQAALDAGVSNRTRDLLSCAAGTLAAFSVYLVDQGEVR